MVVVGKKNLFRLNSIHEMDRIFLTLLANVRRYDNPMAGFLQKADEIRIVRIIVEVNLLYCAPKAGPPKGVSYC